MKEMKRDIMSKSGKALLLGAACAIGAGMLGGCQADMDCPGLEIPVATIEANTTILELKDAYSGTTAQIGLKPDGSNTIIKGRVVSSDASGNIYKSLVIQDETAALSFSLNQGSMYNAWRLGQEVVVDMTGLWIGYYSGLQQIGAPDEPYKGEEQLGFMAYDYWLKHAQRNGLPTPEFKIVDLGTAAPADDWYCLRVKSISDLSSYPLTAMQSQLVELINVHFQEGGKAIFADYQENANRTLVDANGQTITVRNSGYSNFYNDTIPAGTGKVRGILGYYQDSWQLTLRDRNDVMISEYGTEEKPYSVGQILSGDYSGLAGWAEGYIVGSVKAGVTAVTGNEDIIFGADAEMDNNLVIAAAPTVKDWSECVVVELPQNSVMRYYGNLADNPDVYGKKMTVNATQGFYMGMAALVDCAGTRGSFTIEGKDIGNNTGDSPRPSGNGTLENPYNIGYVLSGSGDESDVWVQGYVAGYVAQGDFAAGAYFGAEGVAGSSNFLNNSNVILSEVAPPASVASNSAPLQLSGAFKTQLGLNANPGIYGVRVKVKCRITDWLGTRAMRNITECVVE